MGKYRIGLIKELAMKLKIEDIQAGLHPSEKVAIIETKDGMEAIAIHPRSILTGNYLEVGWPVGGENGFYLVELPRQTDTGAYRVWINKEKLEDSDMKVYA